MRSNSSVWQTVVLLVAFNSALFPGLASADSPISYHFIRERRGDGAIDFRVIAEDTTLRDDPSAISQRVVHRETIPVGESSRIAQIEKAYLSQKGLGQSTDAFGFGADPEAHPLWVPVKDSWSDQDEDDYSHWFATQVTTGFNRNTGLLADCADTALLFRWVYAREHLLPVASTLAGSGKLFGHFSASRSWDRLKSDPDWRRDERFKSALRYLFDNTYTLTVDGDLYPTQVNPKYVRPGSIFMILRTSGGHTQTISAISPSDGVTTFWGNEPAAETIYPSGIIVEFGTNEGFKSWRRIRKVGSRWSLTPAEENPGYSREQYEAGIGSQDDYFLWFYERLGIQSSDALQLGLLTRAVISDIAVRRTATAEGVYPCHVHTCDKSSVDYGSYSTFSRDKRLRQDLSRLAAILTRLGPTDPVALAAIGDLDSAGAIVFGTDLTYHELALHPERAEHFDSEPTGSFARRWGLDESDPTVSFFSTTAWLETLLQERTDLVRSAYYLCLQGHSCPAGSETSRSLETTSLDAGVRAASDQAYALASGVKPADLALLHARFASKIVDLIVSPQCSHPDECSFDDLIWGEGATHRLLRWSSEPSDAPWMRWGLPAPQMH